MVGDLGDPLSMGSLIVRYLKWQEVQNYSDRTIQGSRLCLRRLCEWCEDRDVTRPGEVTKPILDRYKRHLFYYRTKGGKPLSFVTQRGYLSYVRVFFSWLARNNYIPFDPAAALELPKVEKRLPRFLTASEAEQVLGQTDVRTWKGIRDRAIMETLYSTGMRRSELCNLKLNDMDIARGTVMINLGKGGKDRMVPIGERAISWIVKYLNEVRAELLMEPDEGVLFLNALGEQMSLGRLTQLVHRYIKEAKLGKSGACHIFRHSMATEMLENGADIRYIQEMLGHEKLCSTQVYTHLSIRRLKEIHEATHPARIKREKKEEEKDDDDLDEPAETTELLSCLALEGKEEDDWTN